MGRVFQRSERLQLRLWYLATGWGFVGLVYSVTRQLQGPATFLVPETVFDRWIGFNPSGIWIYLSFFALIPSAYLLCDVQRLRWLRRSMQLCALICGAWYLFWPSTLVYPAVDSQSASAAVLRWLIGIDSAQNCLPSLHGALSLLAIQALLPAPLLRTVLLWVWGVAIACAVVQTRRHLLLDFSAGVLVGWLVGAVVRRCLSGPAQEIRPGSAVNKRRTAL